MKRIITHLQEKPESHRTRIAFGVASGVTAAVFLVWISTLGVRLSSSDPLMVDNSPESSVAAVPLSGGGIEEQLRALGESFGQVQESVEDFRSSFEALTATSTDGADEASAEGDVMADETIY